MKETLIDEYLDRQSLISAVENFSIKHDLKQFDPKQKKHRELIPQKVPGKGQQYAFEVDLDKCTGCKACVTACHNENGLAEDETWRSVGLIQGSEGSKSAIQHVTTACHHCLEPACLNGCPTKAYTKDPETGIVKHLDDQCFGCQYCILKCPYDVPKYSKEKGIVHKCDMCIGRLEKGQAPACVRACPTGAIRITIVDTAEVKANSSDFVKIPDAPSSDYTFPTTRYKTNRVFPNQMVSMDYHDVKPEHAHLPLVFMLVLTQLSVGAFSVLQIVTHSVDVLIFGFLFSFQMTVALGLGLLALGASILHLGRPLYAFRAILGLKTSWLSREILAFGLFAKLAVLYVLCSVFVPVGQFVTRFFGVDFIPVIGYLVVVCGWIGVLCSVMVYRDTKRPFWDNPLTFFKFSLTSVLLGSGTVLSTSIIFAIMQGNVSVDLIMDSFGTLLCLVIVGVTVIKLFLEITGLYSLFQPDLNFAKKTAILMTRQLKRYTQARYVCGFTGGCLLPILMTNFTNNVSGLTICVFSILILGLTTAGELLERYLFFRAVIPLKMPGGSVVS